MQDSAMRDTRFARSPKRNPMSSRFVMPHEPRPADFSARLRRRRVRSIGAERFRRHRGRRSLALLAAIAMPAFASPESWPETMQAFEIGDAGRAKAVIEPMPFEQTGSSFPGSAFYYLAADDQQLYWTDQTGPPLAEGIHSNGDHLGRTPFARSLRIDNSGIDRTRALQCMTAAVYYEARSEPDAGQRAVAQVVLNRVAHPSYPDTVCGVVFQGSERATGCQFSFTCDGSMARAPNRMFWLRAENVAREALSGHVYTPVGLATHYHTIAIYPYWAPKLSFLGTIGAHRFYKFGGAAGSPGTFRFAYAGGEPVAAPHARRLQTTASGEDMTLDPLAIQQKYETATKISPQAAAGSGPVYATELEMRGGDALYRGNALPEARGIRPEYANSGKWIIQPGT